MVPVSTGRGLLHDCRTRQAGEPNRAKGNWHWIGFWQIGMIAVRCRIAAGHGALCGRGSDSGSECGRRGAVSGGRWP